MISHGGHLSLVEKWLPTADSLDITIKIAAHEMLHEVVNKQLGIPNTAFTEALFDVLCERQETGLWFAKKWFKQISKFIKEGENQK